jgi:single-strand DNA-binding protein
MPAPTIHLIGNLGGDPELRYTQNQQSVTSFSVAVNLSKPDGNGGWNEKTDWYRCTLWGKRGETLVEKLRKGNKIYVVGTLETREFDGRDGQRRTSLDVRVETYQDLEKRQYAGAAGAETYGGNEPAAQAPTPSGNADIDDLPF